MQHPSSPAEEAQSSNHSTPREHPVTSKTRYFSNSEKNTENYNLTLNIQKTQIMASGPITSWETDGETVADFISVGSKITADEDCSHEIKMLAPWKKSYDQLRQLIKKQRHYFADKGPSSQSYGFSNSHDWM